MASPGDEDGRPRRHSELECSGGKKDGEVGQLDTGSSPVDGVDNT